jgi:hypothetical protein
MEEVFELIESERMVLATIEFGVLQAPMVSTWSVNCFEGIGHQLTE